MHVSNLEFQVGVVNLEIDYCQICCIIIAAYLIHSTGLPNYRQEVTRTARSHQEQKTADKMQIFVIFFFKCCLNSMMKVHYPKLYNMAHILSLNVFTASKGSNNYILFAITAAGVVPCGGPKKSPRTSSIVQIIFFF